MTEYYRRDQKGPYSTTKFSAVGKATEESGGSHPTAWVEMIHEREHPNFANRTYNTPDPRTGARTTTVLESTQFDTPTELFTNSPSKISEAFAHPAMTHTVPTLLGLAGAETQRRFGKLPMPDQSLSKHSSAMVQKIRSKGVNLPTNPFNPTNAVTNDIDEFGRTHHYAHPDGSEGLKDAYWDPIGKQVPTEQVRSGRQLMKSILRPHPATQGEQFRA